MAYKQISPVPVVEGGTSSTTLTSNGVLYGTGTSAPGSISLNRAGSYLASQAGLTAPVFTNGNSLVLVSSRTVTPGTQVFAFTSAISNTYNTYFLLYTELSASVGHTDTPLMQVSTNNGSSYISSGYHATLNWFSYNSTSVANLNSTTQIALGASPVGGSVGVNGYLWMHNLSNGADFYMYGQAYDDDGGAFQRHMTISSASTATNVNAFRIFWNGGATVFGTGTFSLYGLLE